MMREGILHSMLLGRKIVINQSRNQSKAILILRTSQFNNLFGPS